MFNLSASAKVRWNHGVRVHSGLVFWRHRFTKIGWIRAERDKRAPRALHLVVMTLWVASRDDTLFTKRVA